MAVRRRRSTQIRKTTRTVHFYRLHNGSDGAGGFREYDIATALVEVAKLPFQGGARYQDDVADETVLVLWPDGKHGAQHRMRFATIRRAALPLIEEGGTLTDLVIPPDAGIAEITHITVFPGGVVGVLFNSYGPRPPKLAAYLATKCPEPWNKPQLGALLRPDVAAQLARLEQIRLIDISVQHGSESLLEAIDEGLASVFRAARDLTDAQRVRLVAQPRAYEREGLGHRARQLLGKLAGTVGLSEILDRFVVKGVDPKSNLRVDIDVLKELLVSSQEVVFLDNRSRALDDNSAYGAIAKGYVELGDQIRRAATVMTDDQPGEA